MELEQENAAPPTNETKFGSGPPPSVEELRTVALLSDLPEDGLSWMASQMSAIELAMNEIAVREGAPADHLFVILTGEVRGERNDGRVFVAGAGSVTGLLPFSRLTHFPASIRASLPARIATLHRKHFTELAERLPILQGRLVNLLTDRVRDTAAAEQQREKMTALGKLSAGLAHELNNPASAARRAADSLRTTLLSLHAAALKLDRDGLPLESRVFLTQLEAEWTKNAGPQSALDSLERSDREEELSEWLTTHNISAAWNLATALVDVGCTRETLERVAQHIPGKFLNEVLIKLTAVFTISRLADEIESSTGRISELVRAIKEYSYMDQMPQQEIDVHQGLENTLLMLRHQLKKGVEIVREYDRTLPKISAYGSELNQVWTNLIINASDAMHGSGKLIIRTTKDDTCLRVEIIDNGPGIPPEIRNRIFEPFFTTKGVGEGTGLGLDIVMRIVRNHRGDISFESRPGETRFSVRLPFSGPVWRTT